VAGYQGAKYRLNTEKHASSAQKNTQLLAAIKERTFGKQVRMRRLSLIETYSRTARGASSITQIQIGYSFQGAHSHSYGAKDITLGAGGEGHLPELLT
jgi:hypothetical protein